MYENGGDEIVCVVWVRPLKCFWAGRGRLVGGFDIFEDGWLLF